MNLKINLRLTYICQTLHSREENRLYVWEALSISDRLSKYAVEESCRIVWRLERKYWYIEMKRAWWWSSNKCYSRGWKAPGTFHWIKKAEEKGKVRDALGRGD